MASITECAIRLEVDPADIAEIEAFRVASGTEAEAVQAYIASLRDERQAVLDAIAPPPIASTAEPLRTATPLNGLRLLRAPMSFETAPSIRRVGEAFHDMHMAHYGRELDPLNNEDDYQVVLSTASAELEAQISEPNSGVGWYSADVGTALGLASRVYPTLATEPSHRDLFLMFAGVFSNGATPQGAFITSAEAFDMFLETGAIPTLRGGGTAWGVRNNTNVAHLKFIKYLNDTLGGLEPAMTWLMQPQTPAAIDEMMRVSGYHKEGRYVTKKALAGPPAPGMLAFGPKLGRYAMGLHGFDIEAGDVTIDLWYTRTYRRWIGGLFNTPIGGEGVVGAPTEKDRTVIRRVTGDLSQKFGYGASDTQALLWFFEKRLWGAQGINTDQGTNADGARQLLIRKGIIDGGQAEVDRIDGTRSAIPHVGLGFDAAEFFQSAVGDSALDTATRPQLVLRPDGMVELTHWSDKKRTSIKPTKVGTGPFNSRERRGGREVSFFGVNVGTAPTGYRKEVGLGPYRHSVMVDPARLYPWFEDPDGLRDETTRVEGANGITIRSQENIRDEYEDAIQAAGYLGYYVTDDGSGAAPLGNVAALFEATTPSAVVDETSGQADVRADGKWRFAGFTQGERGRIVLPPQGQVPTMTLFAGADLSTPLHEMGHQYLYIMQQLVSDGLIAREGADPTLAADWTAINAWWRQNADGVAADAMKAAKGATITAMDVQQYLDAGTTNDGAKDRAIAVGLQEQWARAFETYLMEGKSPSIALRGAFTRFKAWFTAVYRSAVDLKVNVSPEIREVFDRMFATEAELADAREEHKFGTLSATDAKAMGVDDETWARLLALQDEAASEQEEALLRDIMAPLRRAKTEEYRAAKAEITDTVRAGLITKPVHRLREWVGNGKWHGAEAPGELPEGMRLDRGELTARYGDGILRLLPRGKYPLFSNLGQPGMALDEAAELFGFNGGDEMVQTLQHAPSLEGDTKAEVDAKMKAKYPDPMLDDSIEQAAIDALHGEKAGQLLVAELRALSKSGGVKGRVTPRQQAREVARRTIAAMPVREAVRSYVWQAAERKAATAATEALAKGDRQGAFDAKRKQLINHMLYSESRKAAELVALIEGRTGRLKRKGTRQNLAPDYLEPIDAILDTYEFTRVSNKQLDRRAALQAYVQRMKDAGRENELAIPPEVLERSERINYRQLTVEQLQGVHDALTNIEHTARMKQKLLVAKAERDLAEIAAAINANFVANVPLAPRNRVRTKAERRKDGLKGYLNLILNAATLLRKIDGQQDGGAAYEAIKAPIDAATRDLTERQRLLAEAYERLYAPYTRAEINDMAAQTHRQAVNAKMSRWDVISVALNMGNADNLDRLTDRGAHGFSREQVDALVGELTERDWAYVRGMWELIDSYWPDIAAREKRLTGVAPVKVQAVPFQTKFGTMPGGYYPIRYDGQLSAQVTDEQTTDLMKNVLPGKFGKAQTAAGHLIERKGGGGGRALALGVEVAHRHLGQVIHDLAYSEAITASWRVLQTSSVREGFQNHGMLDDLDKLELWLQDVASGKLAAQDLPSRMAARLKSNFTLSKLAFNLSTVAVQLTGLSQSMVVVGKQDFARGVFKYTKNMRAASQAVMVQSALMRERQTTFNKDINDIIGNVSLGPIEGNYDHVMRKYVGPAGFWLVQKVQFYGVDMPTWIAAHDQGLRRGMTDEEAVAHADATVIRAQAGGEFSDQSAFERGTLNRNTRQSAIVRLFTTLGSYAFAKMNVAYERNAKAKRVFAANGFNQVSAAEAFSLAADMAMLFVVEAILYGAIKGSLPGMGDDEEEDPSWPAFLVTESILSSFAGLPFLRDLTGPLQGFSQGGAYGGLTETLTKPLIEGMASVEDEAVSLRLVKSITNAIGLATGLPSTATNRVIDGLWRASEGTDVSPIEYIMGRR